MPRRSDKRDSLWALVYIERPQAKGEAWAPRRPFKILKDRFPASRNEGGVPAARSARPHRGRRKKAAFAGRSAAALC